MLVRFSHKPATVVQVALATRAEARYQRVGHCPLADFTAWGRGLHAHRGGGERVPAGCGAPVWPRHSSQGKQRAGLPCAASLRVHSGLGPLAGRASGRGGRPSLHQGPLDRWAWLAQAMRSLGRAVAGRVWLQSAPWAEGSLGRWGKAAALLLDGRLRSASWAGVPAARFCGPSGCSLRRSRRGCTAGSRRACPPREGAGSSRRPTVRARGTRVMEE